MKINCVLIVIAGLSVGSASVVADELEYKYNFSKKVCENSDGRRGYNDGHIGECGQLRSLDLIDQDFSGTSFVGAFIYSVDFSGSTFKKVSFNFASISDTSFRNTKMSAVSFVNVKIMRNDFSGSNLNKVIFVGSLDNSLFENAKVEGGSFNGSMHETKIISSNFTEDSRLDLDVSNSEFSKNIFRGAEEDEIFISFNVKKSSFIDNNVEFAYFTNSDLRAANFKGNRFKNVYFGSVDFTGADLSGAQFEECTISSGDFIRSDLSSTIFDDKTIEGMGSPKFHQALYDDKSQPFSRDFPLAIKLGMYKKPY